MTLKGLIASFWRILTRPPAKISLGLLTLGGFITGIIFWGGFNTAMEFTNTETFCVSCHEMRDNVYQELKQTVHWSNRTGVRATCPDCHVPHDWTNKIARKMQASKEFWGHVFGTIDTREKFLEKRFALAQNEWARLDANNSLECRNCHDYDSMDWDGMTDTARFYMKRAAETNQSCIDCHKGIAHELPDDLDIANPALMRLQQQASSGKLKQGETYFTLNAVDVFEAQALQSQAGTLELATEVNVIETKGDKVQLSVSAWRKEKGYGRVLYDDFARNIRAAILTKEVAQNETMVAAGEARNDDLTGLDWREVEVKLWAAADSFVLDIAPLWEVASETYVSACSVCHAQPDPAHFDSNAWPGQFAGMVGFTNMDQSTEALVLKYLQKHSSDYSDGAH
jgi:trimethylamine-N-oxide reductase cytochrome c-type subunit TorC